MENKLIIPVRITLLNWLITILVGSCVYSVLEAYFTSTGDDLYQIGLFAGIAALVSGLCSLPALVIILLVNRRLNKRSISPGKYQQIHTFAQLILVGGSFLWPVLWAKNLTYVELIYLLPLFGSYTSVTLIVWGITFSIYRPRD